MKSFPQMLSAVLMPNHGHFILPNDQRNYSEPLVLNQLCGIIGQISRRKKVRGYWQPIPLPTVIPDRHHLKRHVRYVALNPCRKGLCRDPLEWYWSTYRELFGAVAMPHTSPKDAKLANLAHLNDTKINNSQVLAEALGDVQPEFLDRFHLYVSGDPSVAVSGTPRPIVAQPQLYAYKSIDEILAASAAALRVLPSTVKKRGALRILFIHLAHQHGWRLRTSLLAEVCSISTRAVRLILQKPAPTGIEAAHLCLSDSRLRPVRVTEHFSAQSTKRCKLLTSSVSVNNAVISEKRK